MEVRATGIAWYRREDYPRILAMMTDGHVLPKTWEEWRTKANATERQMRKRGMSVVRSFIDPDKFLEWCVKHGLDPDAKARMQFASEIAHRAYRAEHR
jgi:hypothetical protein